MKRTIVTLATVALVATGCAAEANDDAKGTDKAVTSAEPADVEDDPRDVLTGGEIDDLYVGQLREDIPGATVGVSDDLLIEAGHTFCGGFDDGLTFYDMFKTGIDNGLTAEEIGVMVGSAIAAYCPEHSDALEGY